MEEQNMTGAQTPTGTPGPNNRGTQPPIRTKRNPWIYVIIALCILIPALVVGGFYFYDNKQKTEKQAYALLNNNENVEDYENYLKQFPNSAHADEVRDRLKQLRTMYADWQRIANSGYASDFERFSQNYPQSQLVKQCELKIDSLDWETAKKINTPDAISDYLENTPTVVMPKTQVSCKTRWSSRSSVPTSAAPSPAPCTVSSKLSAITTRLRSLPTLLPP